jgi:hypothetical protein
MKIVNAMANDIEIQKELTNRAQCGFVGFCGVLLNNKIFNLALEGRFYLLAMRFQLMAGNLKTKYPTNAR